MTDTVVETKNVTRIFDVSKPWLSRVLTRQPRQHITAVNGVSFEIERGQTFAIVGESGSGKSTLARMVVGLLAPSRGDVFIEGKSIAALGASERKQRFHRRVQMIFQDPYASLNPRWRVGDIIAEPINAFRLLQEKRDIQEKTSKLLHQVGLHQDDAQKYPHQFSGGQRQRIAIARALASSPSFIVCDEPTSALDVSVQAQILNLLRDLQDELGLTYLFISHNLAVVRFMASQIGIMKEGCLIEVGSPLTIFQKPEHSYTKSLISSIPKADKYKILTT